MRVVLLLIRRLLLMTSGALVLGLWPAAPVRGQDAPPAEPAPAEAPTADETDRAAKEREFLAEVEKLGWKREGKATMGEWAEIEVPRGHRFTGGDAAGEFLRAQGNLVGNSVQGLVAPENLDWFVVFQFEEMGYVKDDEKDKLDADALMKQKKENEKVANERRKEMGLPGLFITGWISPPHYDEATHNLEWGLKLRGEGGGESVNYNMKLLGRKGVMDATLVCDTAAFDTVLPKARKLMSGFTFQSGQTYAEYRKGDKIAQYGLTGLVLGGGAVLAAKSGLFAVIAKFFGKFFKIIIIGLVAIGVAMRKFFAGLFGGRRDAHGHDAPPPPPPPA